METELIRRAAKRSNQHLRDHSKYLLDEASAMARWLMASLLTLNGAGAAAALKVAESDSIPIYAYGSFVLGLLFALLNGWLIQVYASNCREPAILLGDYYDEVFQTGELDEARFEELSKMMDAKEGRGWLAPTAGWISGTCFLFGMAALTSFV